MGIGGSQQNAAIATTVASNRVFLTGTSNTLTLTQETLDIVTGASDMTITLPTVEEALGRFYSFKLTTDGGGDVIIQDATSVNTQVAATMTEAGDSIVIMSSGVEWIALKQQTGLGAVNGTNIVVVESGDGALHKSVFTLTAHSLSLTDETGVVHHGGTKFYDLPEGNIFFLGCTVDVVATMVGSVGDTADGDVGVGTITASNNDTLASTEQNVCPATVVATLSGGTGAVTAISTTSENVPIDGTSSAVDLYLNLLFDTEDVTAGNQAVLITGTIELYWTNLGDK